MPILIFLAFRFNWREKLKWICLLLVVVGFSFDLIGSEARKHPVAEGTVVESTLGEGRHKVILKVEKGELHERQYFRSGEVRGIVSAVSPIDDQSPPNNLATAEINSDIPKLVSTATFQTYSNLKFENISLAIELTIVFILFGMVFQRTTWLTNLSWIAIIVSIVFWAFQNIILKQIHQFAGVYNAVTSILVISFALIYFYYQLSRPEHIFIYRSPVFWIVVGILLYKTGTFFLYLYANNLNLSDLLNFYLFDSIFYILQNILFAVSFTIPDKNPPLKYRLK